MRACLTSNQDKGSNLEHGVPLYKVEMFRVQFLTHNLIQESKPLEKVKIAHVLGRINGSPYLVVVKNNPSTIFQDVCNIVTAVC